MSTTVEVARIGPGSAGILMSPEVFDAIEEYDEDYRYELIHRVLIVTPIPSVEEASPNETLGGLLFLYHEQHPLGSARHVLGRRHANRVRGNQPRDHRDPRPTILATSLQSGAGRQLADRPRRRPTLVRRSLRGAWRKGKVAPGVNWIIGAARVMR